MRISDWSSDVCSSDVGEGVLDLAPDVEAGAADDLVGHAHPGQVLLEHAALRVGAVEDGDVAPAHVAAVVQVGDLAGDPLRLVDLVVAVVANDRVPITNRTSTRLNSSP